MSKAKERCACRESGDQRILDARKCANCGACMEGAQVTTSASSKSATHPEWGVTD